MATPIKLQCICGHTLRLPQELVGQKIRCKRCNKVMRVPPPSDSGPLLAESELKVRGSRDCPSCGRLYPATVVVCVSCGLNLETGAMLYASLEESKAHEKPKRGLLGHVLHMLGFGREP